MRDKNGSPMFYTHEQVKIAEPRTIYLQKSERISDPNRTADQFYWMRGNSVEEHGYVEHKATLSYFLRNGGAVRDMAFTR
jgi:hypothetical protein